MIKVECESCTHPYEVQEEETSKSCPNCGVVYSKEAVVDAPIIEDYFIEEDTLEDE